MTRFVTVTRIGAKGDGIAETDDGLVFVPRGIPGDLVRIETGRKGFRVVGIETPSSRRVAPFCPQFGTCGGCLIQEAEQDLYRTWKRGLVTTALAPLGASECIAALVDAHGVGRRRVTFHARRVEGSIAVGFMQARSHDLVDLDGCPLLAPPLDPAMAVARALARHVIGSGKPIDVVITATEAGLDVDLRGHGPASPELRRRLAAAAEALDLSRLAIHGDIIVELRPPTIRIGRGLVLLPPGGFLQATEMGEVTLQRLVMEAVGPASGITDLFSGIGTFALRLAESAAVHAVEGDAAAAGALVRAVRETQGLKPITVETRDLFRRPLTKDELKRFDAVVLDPPRAGAEAQIRMLAGSSVPRVVSVSCHLGTFVRDASILIEGGYRLVSVTPVDQFRHSAHIELVGVFDRPKAPARRTRRLLG